jgi:type I restriction enzyme R subunit
LPTLAREGRAAKARVAISTRFGSKQQVFLDFVLSQCVIVGLQQEKVSPLLRLKYHDSISDAVKELGKPEEIGQVFSRFQKYLYQQVA